MPNDADMRAQLIAQLFADSAQANMATLAATDTRIVDAADLLIDCLDNGHKVLSCGNGGSAGDAQHFSSELINRPAGMRSRPAGPCQPSPRPWYCF